MNNDSGDWQTAGGKKSAAVKAVTTSDMNTEKPPIKTANSFAVIDAEHSDDESVYTGQHHPSAEFNDDVVTKDETAPVLQPNPVTTIKARSQSWGDMSDEPDVKSVMNSISEEATKCEDFEHKMTFFRELMGSIATSAASLIATERKSLNSESVANDRDTVRKLHDLATYGRSFGESMAANLGVINNAVNDIERQMNTILDGWNKFVRELTGERETHEEQKKIVQRPTAVQPISYSSALSGNVSAPSAFTTLQRPTACNNITIPMGIVDITSPVSTDRKDVPLMCIRYNPTLGVFMINLEGEIYSFGKGNFIYKKGRNNESVLYCKRCDPSIMTCNENTCTYYHDPLKFTNGHVSRDMAIHYITKDLVKGVATDQDILANDTLDRNPFIVEDLVQLGGMLMLKAMAVKSVLSKMPNRARTRRPYTRSTKS